MSKKVCIEPKLASSLKKAILSDEFTVQKLDKMSHEKRVEFFQKYLDEDNAKLLVNGYEKRLTSLRRKTRLDFLDRTLSQGGFATRKKELVEKIHKSRDLLSPRFDQEFIDDIVETRMGTTLTREEGAHLVKLGEIAMHFKRLSDKELIGKSFDELMQLKISDNAFKAAKAEITAESYMNDVILSKTNAAQRRLSDKGLTLTEKIGASTKRIIQSDKREVARQVPDVLQEGIGASKASTASFDASFFGRQGIKPLMSSFVDLAMGNKQPFVDWATGFAKQFFDIAKTLKTGKISKEALAKGVIRREQIVIDDLFADIRSSPLWRAGYFDAAKSKYGIGAIEEAFPTALPEKLRGALGIGEGLGRGYKATEVAYNAAATRMRFKMGSRLIESFENAGINTRMPEIADMLGEVVSSMTGRGEISTGTAQALGKWYFSVRLFTSLIDTVWLPVKLGAKAVTAKKPMVRQASRKLFAESMKPILAWTAILGGLSAAGYTSLDPRDRRFGKVVVAGKYDIDLSGGNLTFWGTIAKILSGKRFDERKGGWIETSLMSGDRWSQLVDTVFSNRLAPVPAMVRDLFKGEHFGGEPVTSISVVTNLLMPITISNFIKEGWDKNDYSSAFIVLVGEGFGFSTRDMRIPPGGKEWKALKQANSEQYWLAVADVNEQILPIAQKYRNDKKFQALPTDEQSKILQKAYDAEVAKTIKKYKQYIPATKE